MLCVLLCVFTIKAYIWIGSVHLVSLNTLFCLTKSLPFGPLCLIASLHPWSHLNGYLFYSWGSNNKTFGIIHKGCGVCLVGRNPQSFTRSGDGVIVCLLQNISICEVHTSQTLVTIWVRTSSYTHQAQVLLWAARLHIRVNDEETGRKEAKEGASRGHCRNDTHTANCVHHSTKRRCNQNLADVDLETNMILWHTHTHIYIYI